MIMEENARFNYLNDNYPYKVFANPIKERLLKDKSINSTCRDILEFLYKSCDFENQISKIKNRLMASMFGVHIRTVERSINRLINSGWLKKIKHGCYQIVIPDHVFEDIIENDKVRKSGEKNLKSGNNAAKNNQHLIYNTTKEKTINRDPVIHSQEDVKKTKRKENIVNCSFLDKKHTQEQEENEKSAESIEEKKQDLVKLKEKVVRYEQKRDEEEKQAKLKTADLFAYREHASRAESLKAVIEKTKDRIMAMEREISEIQEYNPNNSGKMVNLSLNIAEPSMFVMAKVKSALWIYKQQKLITDVNEISDWIKYTIMNQMTDKGEMHAANICLKLVKEGRFTRPKNYEYYAEYLRDFNKSDTQLPVDEKVSENRSEREFKPVEKPVDMMDNNCPEILRAKENFNAVLQKLRLATA